jgi:hypothetical protein
MEKNQCKFCGYHTEKLYSSNGCSICKDCIVDLYKNEIEGKNTKPLKPSLNQVILSSDVNNGKHSIVILKIDKEKILLQNQFPEFMKNPKNAVKSTNQSPIKEIEGYIFDGIDGSQMIIWQSLWWEVRLSYP